MKIGRAWPGSTKKVSDIFLNLPLEVVFSFFPPIVLADGIATQGLGAAECQNADCCSRGGFCL